MNRSSALAVTMLGLAIALPAGSATAQTVKEQLVGTWMLVSWDEMKTDGTKVPPLAGINPKGMMMFDANGHFSFQAVAAMPKIASNDRKRMTREESRLVARGAYSYFGTYSVNEEHRNIILHVERSTFPNANGTTSTRVVSSLTADELKFSNPATMSGRHTQFAWTRAKPPPVAASAAPVR
jgi:hypothetical protein